MVTAASPARTTARRGPVYGETTTAPPQDEHAALPTPAEQPPQPPATQEPDRQRIDAQAASAPAGNDRVTTVSDGLDSGSAGLPSAALGNDFTGLPSTAAGDATPTTAAVANVFDNLPEVSPTAEVSADPPAQTVVADAADAGEESVDNSGALFASNDMSFGVGDVTT